MPDPDVDRADVHPVEERRPELGVVRELVFFVRGRGAGLLQHAVGDRDLPEVVKPAGELELLDLLVVDLELPRDRLDEQSDALRVGARVLVLRIDDADEVLRCAEPRLMLGASLELRRAEGLGDRGAVRAVAVLAAVLCPVQARCPPRARGSRRPLPGPGTTRGQHSP